MKREPHKLWNEFKEVVKKKHERSRNKQKHTGYQNKQYKLPKKRRGTKTK